MTIDSALRHHSLRSKLLHHDVHAYYGHLSAACTFNCLSSGARPFIVTRSGSIGTGRYAAHWTGDNVANWRFLRLSIGGNFLFQIFGIHMVGADICGFQQDSTEELCARWTQLGALYPFARNHNHHQSISQEPYSFGALLLRTAYRSLRLRYSLLKHLYTVLLSIHGEGAYFKPLFMEFQDEECYEQEASETQFMLGAALMAAPLVKKGQAQREVYFPKGVTWAALTLCPETGAANTLQGSSTAILKPGRQIIPNPLPAAPLLFLRSGYAILTTAPALRTRLLTNEFHLTGLLSDTHSVTGSLLFLEDYDRDSEVKFC